MLAKTKFSRPEFLRYVQTDFLPRWKGGVEVFLSEFYGAPAGPDRFNSQADFGWLVTYWRTDPNLPSYSSLGKLPELAVYLSREHAYDLDVVLRQRGGWSHHLEKPVVLDSEQDAQAVADKYVGTMGFHTNGLTVKVMDGFKFSYEPLPWIYKKSIRHAQILQAAFTVFSAPGLHTELMLRHEFIGTKGAEYDLRKNLPPPTPQSILQEMEGK